MYMCIYIYIYIYMRGVMDLAVGICKLHCGHAGCIERMNVCRLTHMHAPWLYVCLFAIALHLVYTHVRMYVYVNNTLLMRVGVSVYTHMNTRMYISTCAWNVCSRRCM